MSDPYNEINEVYEQCEDCFSDVNMFDIIVKETADGNCIYCPKFVQRHKCLEQEETRLCKLSGIDMIKFGKEVERQEKKN
jgi:hypothetical protein